MYNMKVAVGDLLRINDTLTRLEYILGIKEKPIAKYRKIPYKELAEEVFTIYKIILKMLTEERIQIPSDIPNVTVEEYLSRACYAIPITNPNKKSIIIALLTTREREKNILRKLIELNIDGI